MAYAVSESLSAPQVIDRLHLEPHPTCGFVAETYRSRDRIAPGGLRAPFADGRQLGSGLYFLVTPERPVRLHRIRNDQLYHRYLGDPLDVLALYPDGTHAVEVLGPDLAAGQKLQVFLPGGTFHTARVVGSGSWFLGASTEWPGVQPEDVETANPFQIAEQYPDTALLIEQFTTTSSR
jgi:predicted cupin superfamily sugar epimerase